MPGLDMSLVHEFLAAATPTPWMESVAQRVLNKPDILDDVHAEMVALLRRNDPTELLARSKTPATPGPTGAFEGMTRRCAFTSSISLCGSVSV